MRDQTVLKMLVVLEIASAVLIELEIASAVLESKLYIDRRRLLIDQWSAFRIFYAPKLLMIPLGCVIAWQTRRVCYRYWCVVRFLFPQLRLNPSGQNWLFSHLVITQILDPCCILKG